jgi:hypothetical protein
MAKQKNTVFTSTDGSQVLTVRSTQNDKGVYSVRVALRDENQKDASGKPVSVTGCPSKHTEQASADEAFKKLVEQAIGEGWVRAKKQGTSKEPAFLAIPKPGERKADQVAVNVSAPRLNKGKGANAQASA